MWRPPTDRRPPRHARPAPLGARGTSPSSRRLPAGHGGVGGGSTAAGSRPGRAAASGEWRAVRAGPARAAADAVHRDGRVARRATPPRHRGRRGQRRRRARVPLLLPAAVDADDAPAVVLISIVPARNGPVWRRRGAGGVVGGRRPGAAAAVQGLAPRLCVGGVGGRGRGRAKGAAAAQPHHVGGLPPVGPRWPRGDARAPARAPAAAVARLCRPPPAWVAAC